MKSIVKKYGISKEELAHLKLRPLRPKQLQAKFGPDFKVHLAWQNVLAERCDKFMCFIGIWYEVNFSSTEEIYWE